MSANSPINRNSIACGAASLLSLALAAPAHAEDSETPLIARSGEPLDLLLTQAELRSIVRRYEIRTGAILTAPIDDEEVLVTAPGMLAPMRDVSRDLPGGILAPFWAIANPLQGWRIFLPVPPKGKPPKDERPLPDPR